MKKRRKALAALLCLTMVCAIGCGEKKDKEDSQEGSVKEEQSKEEGAIEGEEYLNQIKEAWKAHQAEEIRGYIESRNSNRTESRIDTANQQVKTEEYYVSDGQEELKDTEFLTKEGENYYLYKEAHSPKSPDMVSLKILLESGDESQTTYDDYVGHFGGELFEEDENTEIVSISVTQEGEEEIDGISTEKFTVEYEKKAKAGGELTKEELMGRHGWTEKHLELLEGMSEAVDLYVSMANAEADGLAEEPVTKRETFYLSSSDHKLMRSQKIVETGNYADMALEDLAGVINRYEKSIASQYASSEQEEMEMAMEINGFTMEYVIEEIRNWQVDYSELTTDYLTGEECGTIEGLPADAKEVTWEQYMNNEF